MYQWRRTVTQKNCYKFCIDFLQAKIIVIVIGTFVIVIGGIKCNCKLSVIDINIIDRCLASIEAFTMLWCPIDYHIVVIYQFSQCHTSVTTSL